MDGAQAWKRRRYVWVTLQACSVKIYILLDFLVCSFPSKENSINSLV